MKKGQKVKFWKVKLEKKILNDQNREMIQKLNLEKLFIWLLIEKLKNPKYRMLHIQLEMFDVKYHLKAFNILDSSFCFERSLFLNFADYLSST